MATKNKKPKRPAQEPANTAPPTGTEIVTRPAALPAELPKDEVVRAALSPKEMEVSIREYRGLQNALDHTMPDQIMKIKGKLFRKKGYWRAIRTAFGLSVEAIPNSEQRIDNGTDWGYIVTYRATAPNGKFADGDGACMASEKRRRDDPNSIFATEHNVRSHAHTRGFNRAVSNLVGFGEVSAEEALREEHGDYSGDYPGQERVHQEFDKLKQQSDKLKQQLQPEKPEPQKKPEPKRPEPQKPKQDSKLGTLKPLHAQLVKEVRAYHDKKWQPDLTAGQILTEVTGVEPTDLPSLSEKAVNIALQKIRAAEAAQVANQKKADVAVKRVPK
jgi:hypothetical protein